MSKARRGIERRGVSLRLELLEERFLLSVSPLEDGFAPALFAEAIPGMSGNVEVESETLWVTSTDDTATTGTLRSALAQAQEGDTISFAESLRGKTISLSSTLSVDCSLTLDGTGQGVTLDGTGGIQILKVLADNVKILGVTFANGGKIQDNFDGGAISVAASSSLTLIGCTLKNNQAYNGGAISCSGTLNLYSCLLYGNTAETYGGAVFGYAGSGQIQVINSTIAGNISHYYGGGIAHQIPTTITNSIVALNYSANSEGANLEVNNELTRKNSYIPEGIDVYYGTDTDGGGNLSTVSAGPFVVNPVFTGNMLANRESLNLSLNVNAVELIDTGDTTLAADIGSFDAAGHARQVGIIDLGALEVQAVSTLTVPELQVQAGDYQILATWQTVSGAESYVCAYREGTSGAWNTIPVVGNATSYTISSLAAKTTYQVKIMAVGNAQTFLDSAYSEPLTVTTLDTAAIPLATPTGVTATASYSSVSLTWDAVSGATSYTVTYRKANETAWTEISGIPASSRQITGLAFGTEYQFRVRAIPSDTRFSRSEDCSPLTVTTRTLAAGDVLVSGNGDETDDTDSVVTLREAIAQVATGGTILFDASLANTTITLADGLTVRDRMTIDATGMGITLNGFGLYYTSILNNTGTGLTLKGITLTGAETGMAALSNSGTMTLEECRVTRNATRGIYNHSISGTATLNIVGGEISQNISTNQSSGGGIYNGANGQLTIRGTRIFGNESNYNVAAGSGGGVFNMGTATLVNCELAGNFSKISGGAFFNGGGADATLVNCTVAGNMSWNSGAGICLNAVNGDSTLRLYNSILANNLGDRNINLYLYESNGTAKVYLANSLLGEVGNEFVDEGGNLAVATDPGFVEAPSMSEGDGRYTLNNAATMNLQLLDTSALIDRADSTLAATYGITTSSVDCGGHTRIVNGVLDIGAYENPTWVPATNLTAPSLTVVTRSSSVVRAAWTPIDGAVSYQLQYQANSDTDWTDWDGVYVPNVLVAGQVVADVETLECETAYRFRVRALGNGGTSLDSSFSTTQTATTTVRDEAYRVFHLESRPDSAHTIYLDFTGHITTGTWWNTMKEAFYSIPYDDDGDINTFNAKELAYIETAWKKVAEDYAPFDVNVTTQAPTLDKLTKSSDADTTYGVRVVMSWTWNGFYSNQGMVPGGISYQGSFTYNNDTPAFVFLSSSKTAIYEGGVATHEVGHTLGLQHSGYAPTDSEYYTGHTDSWWGPIMGSTTEKTLNQWSNNQYAGAWIDRGNRATQDEVALLGAALGFAPDDVGNTLDTATEISVEKTGLVGSGVIQRRDDVDFFRFTTVSSGEYTFQIGGEAGITNLDTLVELRDSTGTTLKTWNPIRMLDVVGSTGTLAAGTYYLAVSGTGTALDPKDDTFADGVYSDYGSLGQYTLQLTARNVSSVVVEPIFFTGVLVRDSERTETTTLPLSIPADSLRLDEWETLWVEFWSTGDTTLQPSVPQTVVLQFDTTIHTPTGISEVADGVTLNVAEEPGILRATFSVAEARTPGVTYWGRVQLAPAADQPGVRCAEKSVSNVFQIDETPLTTVLYAMPYDLDESGGIHLNDLIEFIKQYDQDTSQNPDAAIADFDGNGKVALNDLIQLVKFYGTTKESAAPIPLSAASSHPTLRPLTGSDPISAVVALALVDTVEEAEAAEAAETLYFPSETTIDSTDSSDGLSFWESYFPDDFDSDWFVALSVEFSLNEGRPS